MEGLTPNGKCLKREDISLKKKNNEKVKYDTFSEKKWNCWDNFSDKLRNRIMKVQFGKL